MGWKHTPVFWSNIPAATTPAPLNCDLLVQEDGGRLGHSV